MVFPCLPIGHVCITIVPCQMSDGGVPETMPNIDDHDGVIWFNGEFVPWREGKVHILTHALHYASSVYEGGRLYGGEVFKLREHCQRLIDSATALDFEMPYSLEEIERAVRDTVAEQGFTDAYVRPIAWRGSETMGVAAPNSSINLAIAVWEWPSYFSRRRGAARRPPARR